MKYSVEKHEKYVLLSLGEEKLDSSVAPKLKSEFITLTQSGTKNLVFDMTEVKYVDSSGLSAILVANRLVTEMQGTLVLTCLSEHVMKLITISKLDSVLNILPSVEEGVDRIFMEELERDLRQG